MSGNDWKLHIAPDRQGTLRAMGLAWAFALGALFLVTSATGAMRLGTALLICLPFPLLISYYALKSTGLGAGALTIDKRGFAIADGAGPPRHYDWRDVERFHLRALGKSPIYEGTPVPHFTLRGGTREGLQANLGFSAEELVRLMERLRRLAEQGWPALPESPEAALSEAYAYLDGEAPA
jgi:hypothetical protein